MQLAVAKIAQPRPSARKPKLTVMHEGIQKADVDKLRDINRTLSAKLVISMKARSNNPTLSRDEERWVFKARGAAVKELRELRKTLEATPWKRTAAIRRLNEEIELKEETIGLATDAIVCANQGMLHMIAREVLSKRRTSKSSHEDLVSVGTESMIKYTMDRFDWKRGRYMTYAASWVRRDMVTEADAHRSDLKVPRYVMDEQHRVSAYAASYREANGTEPSEMEISAGAKVKLSRVGKYDIRKGIALSLDTNNDVGMHEKVAGNGVSLEARMFQDCQVQRCLSTILPEHAKILVLRHVMGYTMQELADMKGCTRGNIGQIETRAKKNLTKALKRAGIRSYE